MGVLTEKKRSNLGLSQFALPDERKYPVPDKAHAVNAKARATQQVNAGNLTPSQRSQIDARANSVLRKSGARGR